MKRDNQLLIRLSEEEKRGFELAAGVAGISMSAWARQQLRITAASQLRNADQQIPFLQTTKRP
jgi:hypothetical protein